MQKWQIQQLEGLYRKAVSLYVNAASMVAPCEMGCGRFGVQAHHVIARAQEPGIRWKYEPGWGLWLCTICHGLAHTSADEFVGRILQRLKLVRPAKARTLRIYIEKHDRLRCPHVSFEFMRDYLRRRVANLQRSWADAYCCDQG